MTTSELLRVMASSIPSVSGRIALDMAADKLDELEQYKRKAELFDYFSNYVPEGEGGYGYSLKCECTLGERTWWIHGAITMNMPDRKLGYPTGPFNSATEAIEAAKEE